MNTYKLSIYSQCFINIFLLFLRLDNGLFNKIFIFDKSGFPKLLQLRFCLYARTYMYIFWRMYLYVCMYVFWVFVYLIKEEGRYLRSFEYKNIAHFDLLTFSSIGLITVNCCKCCFKSFNAKYVSV